MKGFMRFLHPGRPVTESDLSALEMDVCVCRGCGGYAWVPEDLVHLRQQCPGRGDPRLVSLLPMVLKPEDAERIEAVA
jgi:hypothetical protein